MMNGAESSDYPARGAVKDTMVRGICPEGWHVPSDAEWDTLTHYVFNSTSPDYKCGEDCGSWSAQSDVSCIAKALASKTGWNTDNTACNVGNSPDNNDATGFAAVPAGRLSGSFLDFGIKAYFWSATEGDGTVALYRDLYVYDSFVFRNYGIKGRGFSVRCVRDNEQCTMNNSGFVRMFVRNPFFNE